MAGERAASADIAVLRVLDDASVICVSRESRPCTTCGRETRFFRIRMVDMRNALECPDCTVPSLPR